MESPTGVMYRTAVPGIALESQTGDVISFVRHGNRKMNVKLHSQNMFVSRRRLGLRPLRESLQAYNPIILMVETLVIISLTFYAI